MSEVSSGSVRAYEVDPATGAATFLNAASTLGTGPVTVSVDPFAQFVFVAHYGSGNVAVLPLYFDGSLLAATDLENDVDACAPACPVGPTHAANAPPGSFAISGHDAPHAHTAQMDPAGTYVIGQDLGLDRTIVWQIDRASGTLTPHQTVPSSPGAGPRHLAFHPNGEWVYSLNEEASTVAFMLYDRASGTLTPQQEISTLPPGFVGTSFASEIVVARMERSCTPRTACERGLSASHRDRSERKVFVRVQSAKRQRGSLSREGQRAAGADESPHPRRQSVGDRVRPAAVAR